MAPKLAKLNPNPPTGPSDSPSEGMSRPKMKGSSLKKTGDIGRLNPSPPKDNRPDVLGEIVTRPSPPKKLSHEPLGDIHSPTGDIEEVSNPSMNKLAVLEPIATDDAEGNKEEVHDSNATSQEQNTVDASSSNNAEVENIEISPKAGPTIEEEGVTDSRIPDSVQEKVSPQNISAPSDTDDGFVGGIEDEMYVSPSDRCAPTTQTRDEYEELSNSRAREARVKQQSSAMALREMYSRFRIDFASGTVSGLHGAVVRGDEDKVRQMVLGAKDVPNDSLSDLVDVHVRDKCGRTALHLAAAGNNPSIVSLLLMRHRNDCERAKATDMQRLKQERRECIVELQKSIEERNLGLLETSQEFLSSEDYRVRAIEAWFEREVSRLHRRVELEVEDGWMDALTCRDNNGLTPLHHCVNTGSAGVLQALIFPMHGGRGEFTETDVYGRLAPGTIRRPTLSRKGVNRYRVVGRVRGHEWFNPRAVYSRETGDEVVSLDGTVGSTLRAPPPVAASKSQSTLIQSGNSFKLGNKQTSSSYGDTMYLYNDATTKKEEGVAAVDYEVVIPWLVRNIFKRASEMGSRLGASPMDILDELVDMVDPLRASALVAPEVRDFLGYLGIMVTSDIIKELCNVYPADMDAVENKWMSLHARPRDSDRKSSKLLNPEKKSSKGSKGGSKKSSKKNDARVEDNDDDVGGAKAEGKHDEVSEELLLGEDMDYGLDVARLLDDISTGRGMKSIVKGTQPKFTETGDEEEMDLGDTHENDISDEDVPLSLPSIVSIVTVHRHRVLVVNTVDASGNTPLLAAAALSRREHVDHLMKAGADTLIISKDGRSPLSVATDACIVSSLQKDLVLQLKKSKNTVLKNGLSQSTSLECGNSKSVTMGSSGKVLSETAQAITRSCGSADGLLLHLQQLQRHRWAYSQSALTWAVESGMSDLVNRLLSVGANPNSCDAMGRTPLHECVSLVGQISADNVTHLESAITAVQSLRAMVEALIASGADVNARTVSGRTPLHELFCKGQDFEVPLYRQTSNKTSSSGSERRNTMNVSQKSVMRAKSLVCRSLLQLGGDALALDRQGYCPLLYCAREDASDCILEMLNAGVNIYFRCPRGRTALHIACIHGAESVASIICKWDADNKHGVQLVRDKAGKIPRDLCSPRMTQQCMTTIWQACRAGNSLRVNEIISRRQSGTVTWENVNAAESTAAARRGMGDQDLGGTEGEQEGGGGRNRDLWMLDGVDAKTRIHRWTPLHTCIIGWAEWSVETKGNMSAKRALGEGMGQKVSNGAGARKKTLDGRSNGAGARKKTLDGRSLTPSHAAVLSVLLQNFAYVDSLDSKCRTPLHYAAACNLADAVGLLCTGGCEVNKTDLDGNSALHYAYAFGSVAAVSVLENRGADVTIENNNGMNPIDVTGNIRSVPTLDKR